MSGAGNVHPARSVSVAALYTHEPAFVDDEVYTFTGEVAARWASRTAAGWFHGPNRGRADEPAFRRARVVDVVLALAPLQPDVVVAPRSPSEAGAPVPNTLLAGLPWQEEDGPETESVTVGAVPASVDGSNDGEDGA